MIEITMLADPERFLSVINNSHGDVILQLPDESRINLKESKLTQQLIRLLKTDAGSILIDVTDRKDIPAFIRYLTEAAYE